MVKMLVVEDEKVIRDGLMKHVPWQELGVGEIRQAANAQEVLSMIRDFVPDIVSSDIRMPGMSGVELCTRLRELFPDITILFVTGYSDKEYLKAAINLHAIRYVEKPIQMAEYSDAVEEAVRQVRRIREQKASQLRTITFGAEKEIPLTAKYNWIGLLHLERAELAPLIRERLNDMVVPLQKQYDFNFLTEQRDSDNIMLLLACRNDYSASRKEQILQMINRSVAACTGEETKWFLSYGPLADSAEKLRDSWNQADYGLGTLAYLGWNRSVMPPDWEKNTHDAEIPSELTEPLEQAIAANDLQRQKKYLETIYQYLKEQEVFLRADIRFLYLNWYQSLLRVRRQRIRRDSVQENIPLFEKAQTYQEMQEILTGLFSGLTGEEASDETGTASYLVQKVTEYISGHYGDRELSIRVLAEQVGLTPTYLSNLFKKDTGVTIGQYLMDVRMEYAKHLLRDPQRKIYEIADQVGYEDVDYFARVFKRATGMTPSEYRRRQL